MHARRNLSKVIGRQVLDKISALVGDGIHDADLMLWFSGARPVSVYAQEVHPGTNKYPDAGWAMFRLDSGAVGVVESIWCLPESTPYQIDARMEIIGTEGAMYINCGESGLEIHDAAGTENARHDVLAQAVRCAVWDPARRAAILRRLRPRRPQSGADHARGVRARQ